MTKPIYLIPIYLIRFWIVSSRSAATTHLRFFVLHAWEVPGDFFGDCVVIIDPTRVFVCVHLPCIYRG